MLHKVKKEYQILAAVILMMVVSVGYLVINQREDLSAQLNDNVSASSVKGEVVVESVKVKNQLGTATNVAGPSYSNQLVTFESNLIAPNDMITYEIIYRNKSTETQMLTKAELYPDATDPGAVVYSIGNVKENETSVKPNGTLKVYVSATVAENGVLTTNQKKYEMTLIFKQK